MLIIRYVNTPVAQTSVTSTGTIKTIQPKFLKIRCIGITDKPDTDGIRSCQDAARALIWSIDLALQDMPIVSTTAIPPPPR